MMLLCGGWALQIILISSAGVERNAKVGDDEEARKRDIPIVQLNPGGTYTCIISPNCK
jgi:hypothetical protein